MDDGCTISTTGALCWEASLRRGLICSWLGIQDALRKIHPPSQSLGPWVGKLTNTQEEVYGLISQDRWDKTCSIIAEIQSIDLELSKGMNRSRLESIRRLLMYAAKMYREMESYLKGLHLTMDSRRP